MSRGLKTLWTAPRRQQFVTREELPRLVRIALAEIILGEKIEMQDAPSAASVPPLPFPVKKKQPRAAGHTHRGVCGSSCFDGARRADGSWRPGAKKR